MQYEEARRIILYGDGDLSPSEPVLVVHAGKSLLVCDTSEAGAYVACGYKAQGYRLEGAKMEDVLAENPFAEIVAPGCDRKRVQVLEARARTAVELLAYMTRMRP